jgi:hypothetical protein
MKHMKVVQRIALVAGVVMFSIGAAACGDDSVTPQSPGSTPSGVTTPAAGTTPSPATTNPDSGGAGF